MRVPDILHQFGEVLLNSRTLVLWLSILALILASCAPSTPQVEIIRADQTPTPDMTVTPTLEVLGTPIYRADEELRIKVLATSEALVDQAATARAETDPDLNGVPEQCKRGLVRVEIPDGYASGLVISQEEWYAPSSQDEIVTVTELLVVDHVTKDRNGDPIPEGDWQLWDYATKSSTVGQPYFITRLVDDIGVSKIAYVRMVGYSENSRFANGFVAYDPELLVSSDLVIPDSQAFAVGYPKGFDDPQVIRGIYLHEPPVTAENIYGEWESIAWDWLANTSSPADGFSVPYDGFSASPVCAQTWTDFPRGESAMNVVGLWEGMFIGLSTNGIVDDIAPQTLDDLRAIREKTNGVMTDLGWKPVTP